MIEFRQGSYHFLPPPWEPSQYSKPCIFYNTSTCRNGNSGKCKFSHLPDKRSLRLVLAGPNVCKDFLLNQDGCRFTNRGEGRKCFYSHDLSQAGLPLHDTKEKLVEHLLQLEAAVYGAIGLPPHIVKGRKGPLDLEDQDEIDAANEEVRSALLDSETRRMAFETAIQTRADAEMARARSGDAPLESSQPSPPALIDVKGLSGAGILKACGAENAFRDQKESREEFDRKLNDAFIALALDSACAGPGEDDDGEWETDEDDDLEGSGYGPFGFSGYGGYSEDDMMELACQGVKPWDDDAGAVLAALRGGF